MSIHPLQHGRRAGFTLAEMMVVIVILGLLATLVVPNVIQNLARSRYLYPSTEGEPAFRLEMTPTRAVDSIVDY